MRYILLSEGSSDRALVPILDWSLRSCGVAGDIDAQWADLRRLPRSPVNFQARIRAAISLYEGDLLFIHRDADTLSMADRARQITETCAELSGELPLPPVVKVVPVRTMEAWLLHDEHAIRAAADNPNGENPLEIPNLADIEGLVQPKQLLAQILTEASGLGARRRQRFRTSDRVHRVAEYMTQFDSLRGLSAFRDFLEELQRVLPSTSH